MNIKKHISKKVVGIGLAAGLLLGAGGAAFAFITTTGAGSQTANTGTNPANGIAITDNGPFTGLGPDGPTYSVNVQLTNNNAFTEHVTNLTVTLSTASTNCGIGNFEVNGSPYSGPVTVVINQNVVSGGSVNVTGAYTLGFYNDPINNQNTCMSGVNNASPAVNIAYSSN